MSNKKNRRYRGSFYLCNFCGQSHRKGSKWERDCMKEHAELNEIEDQSYEMYLTEAERKLEEEIYWADHERKWRKEEAAIQSMLEDDS